jgi:biopolymer transport protein ExbD
MTSLIDVIFLLLLFFMLSSTFARHGELPFTAGSSGGAPQSDTPPLFLRLGDERLTLNGSPVTPDALPAALAEQAPDGGPLILALTGAATAQGLVDVLAVLRRVPGFDVTVID